jgi:tetratricopeptide (TPR) repeat protein
MSEKRLKAQTIIPEELYVQRAADRQLKQIIEDMGRPGYVLVARQMGKTNLLLNARRSFAGPGDVFAYLDVSNTFPNLESFFRNITDVVLESAEEVLSEAAATIAKQRATKKLLPHKEHESELRIILRAIKGKLVICLDEIDALTKTQYSDQAFSLIRSIYFSGRANFKEFLRLTYVLSGVAEPADIIKNKEISPFNIGEKIYLEDFSQAEFNEFLQKAGILFEEEIRDAIYGWANGNPRITWDICSAVEDYVLENGSVNRDIVSGIVEKLYLTRFDLPPVDHIRKLVEDDKDVRAALISIIYGKSESISDPLRNRLYLAGICRFDTGSRRVFIKNKIIEASLSEEWIRQVEKEKLSYEEIAKQYFDEGNYEEAAKAYLEYAENVTDNDAKGLAYYYVGLCHYNRGEYSNAVKYLSLHPLKKNVYPKIYLRSRDILGVCNYQLKDYSAAVDAFDELLKSTDQSDSPYEYYDALANYASSIFNSDRSNTAKAAEYYEQVIEAALPYLSGDASDEVRWSSLVALTRTNLSQLLVTLGEMDAARKELSLAIDISHPNTRPERFLLLADLEGDVASRRKVLSEAVDCIVENKLVANASLAHLRRLTSNTCISLLLKLNEVGDTRSLERLLNHLIANFKKHATSPYELAERIALSFLEVRGVDAATYWLEQLVSGPDAEAVDDRTRKFALALLIVIKHQQWDTFKAPYFESLEQTGYFGTPYDAGALYILVMAALNENDYDEAWRIVSVASPLRDSRNNADFERSELLILDYLETITRLKLKRDTESMNLAMEFIDKAKEFTNFQLPFFPKEFTSFMVTSVRTAQRTLLQPVQVLRKDRKIGRNEIVSVRFKEGRVARGKFKKFADYLEQGECELL